MDLKALAGRLGIESYPALAEEVFAALPADDGMLCDATYVTGLEEEWGLLGEYLPLVLRGAEAVRADADLLLWGRLMLAYIRVASEADVRRLAPPELDGSLARDVLPMLVLLQEIPAMVAAYRARGFADEGECGIRNLLASFHGNMYAMIRLKGRPLLDRVHYNWLLYYTRASIFKHKAFQFQEHKWGSASILLRHKTSGEYRLMMCEGRFHRSGHLLGSIAATDEEGAFHADFEETEEAFAGHLADDYVLAERTVLPKTEWECVLRSGDDVVSIHIPRKSNLTPEYVEESLREGLALTRSYYPERTFRAIVCTSWLLEPHLPALAGEGTRLAAFNRLFLKHPIRDRGQAIYTFAFPGCEGMPTESLPEETSLQRNIKTYLLTGKYVYTTAGVITASLSW